VPLYEYQCSRCQHRFEKLQRFSDPPASSCPACGGPVSQILSAPAIQFKGSGWYVTDYAHKSSSPAASAGHGNGNGNGNGSSGNGSGASSPASGKETKSETSAEKK
jgi:putative FmdB family regulatory protein